MAELVVSPAVKTCLLSPAHNLEGKYCFADLLKHLIKRKKSVKLECNNGHKIFWGGGILSESAG